MIAGFTGSHNIVVATNTWAQRLCMINSIGSCPGYTRLMTGFARVSRWYVISRFTGGINSVMASRLKTGLPQNGRVIKHGIPVRSIVTRAAIFGRCNMCRAFSD